MQSRPRSARITLGALVATGTVLSATLVGTDTAGSAELASLRASGRVAPAAGQVSAAAAGQPYKGVGGLACADAPKLNASWYYNWGISPDNCTGPEFVPMIAGKDKKAPGDLAWNLGQVVAAGYHTVLGFNEPNKADQSNITVDQAISLWPNLTSNASVQVGSPAPSGDGAAWFNDFMTKADANKQRVDFLAVHWYGWNAGTCDANAAGLDSHLNWAEAVPGNRPIWITELGCQNLSAPDRATVQTFFTAALAVIARHPRVVRYAWFPYLPNNELVDANGALTPLGQAFAAAPATH